MHLRHTFAVAMTAALLAPAPVIIGAGQSAPAATLKRTVPPVRGVAELGYTQAFKEEKDAYVTTFEVKNMAPGSIVGLQISEFWYNKAGDLIQGTGDRQRLRRPLQPAESATIVMRSPKVPGIMPGSTPQYKFEHQYGTIKTRRLKSLKES
jgi:hypothetical protein